MTAAAHSDAFPKRLDRKRLNAFLENVRANPSARRDELPLRRPGQLVEATDAQQQIWLHAEMAQAPLYNEPVTVHFDGELDVEAFERAFNCILERHEAWRTSFVWSENKLLQVVAPELKVKITAVDLSGLSPAKREAAMLRDASADASGRLALDRLPLFRYRLFKVSEEQYRFYLTLHHIMFDGVSLYRIFLPELEAFYAAFQNGSSLSLPALSHQYADYALYTQQRLESERDRLLAYWAGVFGSPVEPLPLPLDFPRPDTRTFAGEMAVFSLSRELSSALRKTAQAGSGTLFGVLLAAFHILLYSYTGALDQSVGTAVSSRKQDATQQMLGLFLNTVVLRSVFTPAMTFGELLAIVQTTIVDALTHDDISFGELVTRFEPNRTSGRNPLFQVLFSLEPPLSPLGPRWRFTQMDIETRLSKYDLHLEMDEREDGLIGRFIYSVELFKNTTMEGWKSRWLQLLQLITSQPEWKIEQYVSALERNPARVQPSQPGFWEKTKNLLGSKRS